MRIYIIHIFTVNVRIIKTTLNFLLLYCINVRLSSGVPRGGVLTPPPEIPKALQNRAKLNPIVKTVKIAEFKTPTLQDVRKKGSNILKLPRFAIVLH